MHNLKAAFIAASIYSIPPPVWGRPFNHGQFKTCELRPEDLKPSPKKRREKFAAKTKRAK